MLREDFPLFVVSRVVEVVVVAVVVVGVAAVVGNVAVVADNSVDGRLLIVSSCAGSLVSTNLSQRFGG